MLVALKNGDLKVIKRLFGLFFYNFPILFVLFLVRRSDWDDARSPEKQTWRNDKRDSELEFGRRLDIEVKRKIKISGGLRAYDVIPAFLLKIYRQLALASSIWHDKLFLKDIWDNYVEPDVQKLPHFGCISAKTG